VPASLWWGSPVFFFDESSCGTQEQRATLQVTRTTRPIKAVIRHWAILVQLSLIVGSKEGSTTTNGSSRAEPVDQEDDRISCKAGK